MLKLLPFKYHQKCSKVFRTSVDIFNVWKSLVNCWKSSAVPGTFLEIMALTRQKFHEFNSETVGRYTFIACGHNVHLISRSLDNICHYYTFYLSGDVLLSLNKLDLNSSNVHTILAAITGPMEVTFTCFCISYTEISLMVQFSPCLKFYSPLFQKSPSFENPHFQHNAKCKLTFLVEITLI